jgi:tRNA-Thr(GGU) m(6)t(6)A37 methyltransferase TsaA
MSMLLEPIGTFHCDATYPYDAARQSGLSECSNGQVILDAGHNYEMALRDLDGFSRIWLVYLFHHNANWKPLVQPPRADRKIGVFATRAPYRPNPIGLSCVELISIDGRCLHIGPHDLLNGTPILDIKPYLPYADSFPDARCGWLETLSEDAWTIAFAPESEAQLAWLEQRGMTTLRPFLLQQLRERPFQIDRKRIRQLDGPSWEIAYRTWRAFFSVDENGHTITITRIDSGYSAEDLALETDRYEDKTLHREFRSSQIRPGL